MAGKKDKKNRQVKPTSTIVSRAGSGEGLASPVNIEEDNKTYGRTDRLIHRTIRWKGHGFNGETAWIKVYDAGLVELDDNC